MYTIKCLLPLIRYNQKLSTSLVVVALILGCCFGGFFYYQHYEQEQAYQREQRRLEHEEMLAEQKEEEREREKEEREEERERHRQNVHDYADDDTAEWIVSEVYDGGTKIDIDVTSYEYNSYKEEYKIDVSLNWCGTLFTGHCGYAADGIIRVDEDGDNLRWESTWHSSDLKEYLSDIKLLKGAVGTVVVLGAVGEAVSGED